MHECFNQSEEETNQMMSAQRKIIAALFAGLATSSMALAAESAKLAEARAWSFNEIAGSWVGTVVRVQVKIANGTMTATNSTKAGLEFDAIPAGTVLVKDIPGASTRAPSPGTSQNFNASCRVVYGPQSGQFVPCVLQVEMADENKPTILTTYDPARYPKVKILYNHWARY